MKDKELAKVLHDLMEGSVDIIPKELTDKYPTLHWCHEWDLLPVAKGCPEYDYCLCGNPGPYRGGK